MDFLFSEFINNPKIPKIVRFLTVTAISCFVALLGAVLAIVGGVKVAVFFGALLGGAALVAFVYLTIKVFTSKDYHILKISKHSSLKNKAAQWFHDKWGVPESAYLESMEEAIRHENAYPEWYVAIDKNDRIIGGLGVIENDFHDRKDLSPNVCAVYVEEDRRKQGIAGKLLNYVCHDMKKHGLDTLYLLTDHVSFYERYGWEFYCEAMGDGEEKPSRLYIHKS